MGLLVNMAVDKATVAAGTVVELPNVDIHLLGEPIHHTQSKPLLSSYTSLGASYANARTTDDHEPHQAVVPLFEAVGPKTAWELARLSVPPCHEVQ